MPLVAAPPVPVPAPAPPFLMSTAPLSDAMLAVLSRFEVIVAMPESWSSSSMPACPARAIADGVVSLDQGETGKMRSEATMGIQAECGRQGGDPTRARHRREQTKRRSGRSSFGRAEAP